MIVFDTSGSMNDRVPGGRKIDVAKAAVWKFVDSLPRNTNLGLVTFDGGCDATTVVPLRKDSAQTRQAVKTAVSALKPDGSTPIGVSMELASRQLAAGGTRKRRMVVLTDGEDTCDRGRLDSASDAAWKAGTKVYAVGFALGAEPSRAFRRMGIYKDASDDAQLASVFTDIKKSLEKDGSYDESKAAAGDRPLVLFDGRRGHFKSSGGERSGRLFTTMQLKSSYEQAFKEGDRFTVLEHGYHVLFNEQEYTAVKKEVLRVRLEEKPNSLYGGVEGFVLVEDVVVDN